MMTNKETVKGLYDAFAQGDIPGVLGALTDDCSWTEAEGGPYGGTYVGPEKILEGVFMRLGGEWDGFAAVPSEFVAEGDKVISLGEYSATYKETGKSFKAPFAHVWTLEDGKVTSFVQYVDTALHNEPLT